MSKDLFLNESLYMGDKAHEKTVEMLDGTEATVYVRDLRDSEVKAYFAAGHQEEGQEVDEDADRKRAATLISIALVDPEDDSPVITYEQAYRLKYVMRQKFLHAVLDANDLISKAKPGN